jgi:hypothetical protein
MSDLNHSRRLAAGLPSRRFHTRTESLINTGALARRKHAHSTGELFQQFKEHGRKPLKRLIRPRTLRHRAEAPVLMRTCWKACGICGLAAALLLAAAAGALAEVRYVDVNSTNATPPYITWATAATNIQAAVDAAVAGDEVVVTNGTYYGSGLGNRVRVNKPLTVRSANGPGATIISVFGSGTGCVYLTNGASLSGFMLANGSSPGGGVFCESQTAVVSNCVVSGNRTFGEGPGSGAYGGTLNNCTITDNMAYDNSIGGGAGGGAYQCILNNCKLSGNSATIGGGAYGCTLNNRTLTGNSASYVGGGAAGCTLNNCIVYSNNASYIGSNYDSSCTLNYSCTTPQPTNGIGNITNAPLFVELASGNLRLQPSSPCINAGNNSYVTNATDLDGNPRIAGGTVDIGAYELQSPASMISYAWLQQFNLPINPSTDTADPDGDGVDNYHEWLAGTDPTNPLSFPPLLNLIPYGANVILTWPTNAVGFTLQSTTNLGSLAVWSNNSPGPVVIGAQNVIINAVSSPRQFYRLIH